MINLQYPSADTVIDSTEFRTTLNAKHLAQLQYSAFQYNDCLGTRSKASTLSTKKKNYFLTVSYDHTEEASIKF